MDAGYYDHVSLARTIRAEFGQHRTRLLELGVGTGLLAQEILALNPSVEIVGIDFSAAMIEVARRRIDPPISIVQCDIAELELDRKFDAAVSCGGTWVIVRDGDRMQLGTHLFDHDKDLRGIANVANHLVPGGLLLLSVHPPHEDRTLDLKGGITYCQTIRENNDTPDHFSIEKDYCFSRGDTVLAREVLTLGFYEEPRFQEMFSRVDLEPQRLTDDGHFFVLEKSA